MRVSVNSIYCASPIVKQRRIPVIIKVDQKIPLGGHVFPYFSGMNLPDKTGPISFITKHMANILGNTEKSSLEAQYQLVRAWKTLSATEAGIALSHMIFGLELAIQTGCLPSIVHSESDEYLGFVLIGLNLVQSGANVVKALKEDELRHELLSLDTHALALRTIVGVINTYKESDDEYYNITEKLITLPRQLHNILRPIKLSPADTTTISNNLKKLCFRQSYWVGSDPTVVEKTIRMLGSDEFPPSHWPINFKSQVMFTSNRFQSILSVFGSQVPCLSRLNGTCVPLFETAKENTLTKKEGGRQILPELPIYVLPLIEAAQAWKQVFDQRNLYVIFSPGRKGVDSARKAYKADSEIAKSLFRTLMINLPPQVQLTGKRKATSDLGPNKEDSTERKKRKKVQEDLTAATLLASRLGLGHSSGLELEHDVSAVDPDEEMDDL